MTPNTPKSPNTPEDAVVVRRRIRAEPEVVFSYLIDRDRLLSWQGVEAVLDPRPGGMYRIRVLGDAIATGRYTEIAPPVRVVLTWGWENEGDPVPPGSSTLRIELAPDVLGTLLTLTHTDLPTLAREPHRTGWEHYLDRLTIRASGGDPGPDPWEQEAEEGG
ncbi:SRPBCC domain-containing protein [Streptacidiphilus sp. NEAU-YB345]|uniref:SRPBCC domain-containing protein n=1 Tax=Streptacidiphilus fuscans TaxID=2789292 RepID=A0A931FF16_9ACTN|nr:SRPBCC domain-containing protein [Streptacidiphilus fuscans]